MGAICQIFERTEYGVEIIAEIRGSRITGPKAAAIRQSLGRFGFPGAPLEEVIDKFLLSTTGYGVAYIPADIKFTKR